MKKFLILVGFGCVSFSGWAQSAGYWQQKVAYKMDVVVDAPNYQYRGTQKLTYTNNSPDTLKKVYYHLYPNAFQPGSEMDARIQSIADPDGRMVRKIKIGEKEIKESRIKNLQPNEIGYLKISNAKQDGVAVQTLEKGTVLEVSLAQPILPSHSTELSLDFEGQVPVQIRRSGRNNKEGVEFSMAQWYPKLAEFDFEGWHADPYIAREFHGVWGDFDVNITIDKDYVLGASGYLQNKNEIGHGYQDQGVTVVYPKKTKTLTWHYVAPQVHDFTWAADKNYLHDKLQVPGGATLHFLYKNNPKIIENWKKAQPVTQRLMEFYNQTIGNYPYEQFSVIQGGDGGMEYAMCTLILGEGTYDGLIGVIAHEMAHSWFQHILASNESKHPWMDEGFASYLEDLGMNELADKKLANPHQGAYDGYYYLANSGKDQPLSTHGDRYDLNKIYSISSYSKGEVFLGQLGYLIGQENLHKTMKRFYADFKFKHPTPNDIKRTAERVSGAHLDWYLTDWTQTTNTIDYGIKEVTAGEQSTKITLERIGRTPMPIDLSVTYTDGTRENFYIPLRMMHFEKPNPTPEVKRTVLSDWAWAYPTYSFEIPSGKSVVKVQVDPAGFLADVHPENNSYPQEPVNKK
ncbi:MAG: hypothetical protein RL699_539 [Bacteroidota bacterium]|jgi:hypothetical protein